MLQAEIALRQHFDSLAMHKAMNLADHHDSGLPTPRRYCAIFALCLGTALSVIDGTIANVALPTIARDLGVGSTEVVLIITVYQLVLVMTLLPFSALGDRIGHSRLYLLGQLVFALASLLALVATNLPTVLITRALQALGAAASLSVSSAIIRATYPASQLGRGLGLNTVIVTSMNALAPTLGGLILTHATWQVVFAAGAPLALLSMVIGLRSLPKVPRITAPYDSFGALLCALSLGLTVAALETIVHSNNWLLTASLLVPGAGLLIIFIRRELSTVLPILPLDMIRKPLIALSAGGALFAFIASMSFLISFPFRLQHSYGFTPAEVGVIIAAWPLVMIVVAPLAGMLADKFPASALGGIGMTIAALAFALIAFLPAVPTQVDIMVRLALCGIGFGLFLTPNARLLVGSVPRERAASMGGFVSMTRLTGQTLGATLTAALLGLHLGDGPAPALLACGLAVAAGLCSAARLTPAANAAK
jgi:MFS transporter, DHA2 family, multidrug resistance protein